MKNKLQNYFPMIRTQGEVLSELRENTKLWKTFCEWEGKYQQEYLDICTGVKGVKLLYDTYFKAVMNPDTRPERLNDFLSEILGKKVKILKVLPNESAQIAAESSLLIMDIVVQFENGSIALRFKKLGIYFLDKEAHAIRQIYYYDSIRESEQSSDKDSHIEKSRKYIPLFCLKRVIRIFLSFQRKYISTILSRRVIQEWK